MDAPHYETCPACGLVQTLPAPSALPEGSEAACGRCAHGLGGLSRDADHVHDLTPTFAAALAALLLYPVAITLPIMEIERFGSRTEASIWTGSVGLLADGQLFVGTVVVLCSVVLPLGKLLSLLLLSSMGHRLAGRAERTGQAAAPDRLHAWRFLVWRVVEWTGRWGMLDVLLIACLVTWVKLGDYVSVAPGPAAVAFTACVVLSLTASAFFDPRSLWDAEGGAPA